MSRSYRAYLLDIRDCIAKTLVYTEGLTIESFSKDDKTIDAVVRNIEILGEASKRLPEEIKQLDFEIPWKAIAGMRDKLVHDYSPIRAPKLSKSNRVTPLEIRFVFIGEGFLEKIKQNFPGLKLIRCSSVP